VDRALKSTDLKFNGIRAPQGDACVASVAADGTAWENKQSEALPLLTARLDRILNR